MKKSNKIKDVTVNELAVMVANGFSAVGRRFDSVENELHKVSDDIKKTSQDVLNVGDRFIPRHEFDTLLMRVGRLEEKVRTRK